MTFPRASGHQGMPAAHILRRRRRTSPPTSPAPPPPPPPGGGAAPPPRPPPPPPRRPRPPRRCSSASRHRAVRAAGPAGAGHAVDRVEVRRVERPPVARAVVADVGAGGADRD